MSRRKPKKEKIEKKLTQRPLILKSHQLVAYLRDRVEDEIKGRAKDTLVDILAQKFTNVVRIPTIELFHHEVKVFIRVLALVAEILVKDANAIVIEIVMHAIQDRPGHDIAEALTLSVLTMTDRHYQKLTLFFPRPCFARTLHLS